MAGMVQIVINVIHTLVAKMVAVVDHGNVIVSKYEYINSSNLECNQIILIHLCGYYRPGYGGMLCDEGELFNLYNFQLI